MKTGYELITLVGHLTWPPTWRDATPEQVAILAQAADTLKRFGIALEAIERAGTHVCNDDPQMPPGWVVRNREAEAAHHALQLCE